ncbi:hypothetical protein AB835_13615 [Candidatus Endobugula sertula]|uniref:Enamine deaminase RidA n=1 Tax=Candidatus Endobugula sertula TaxID=62101 RepID=A0A1D2QLU7_9GAMM|nr:hypothetical protein AB835_13615 [Candidatus Endobugula sertula]
MKKQKIYSGAPWEKTVSYCRAIRVGDHIFVSGTTSINESGEIIGIGDVYQQAKFIFNKIENVLHELDSSLEDIVRTRTFITDMNNFEGFSKAHGECFSGIDPAATCVEVSGFVDKNLLIEIEVDAIIM